MDRTRLCPQAIGPLARPSHRNYGRPPREARSCLLSDWSPTGHQVTACGIPPLGGPRNWRRSTGRLCSTQNRVPLCQPVMGQIAEVVRGPAPFSFACCGPETSVFVTPPAVVSGGAGPSNNFKLKAPPARLPGSAGRRVRRNAQPTGGASGAATFRSAVRVLALRCGPTSCWCRCSGRSVGSAKARVGAAPGCHRRLLSDVLGARFATLRLSGEAGCRSERRSITSGGLRLASSTWLRPVLLGRPRAGRPDSAASGTPPQPR